MNDLYILKNCFPYGGKTVEEVCQQEIRAMVKRGYEPTQISTAEAGSYGQKIVILFKFTFADKNSGEGKKDATN